jgi:hypothetical protein
MDPFAVRVPGGIRKGADIGWREVAYLAHCHNLLDRARNPVAPNVRRFTTPREPTAGRRSGVRRLSQATTFPGPAPASRADRRGAA